MKLKKRLTVLNIIPYIILLICAVSVVLLKQNYMVDEIFSYGLANHTKGTRIVFQDGRTYAPACEPYLNYMNVSESARFNYANVWKNQADNVHPPLYYALLHTICSFFPGQYCRVFAGGINIAFVLASLLVLRACLRCFTENEWTVFFFSIAYAVSPGILNNVSFFRMYVMAMSINTAIWFLYLNLCKCAEPDGKPLFYIMLGVLAVTGALTHYYCVIFTLAVSLVYTIRQLFRKRYADVIRIGVTGVLSGTCAYLIFPAMIDHVFHGYRGQQSIGNLKQPAGEILHRFREYFVKTDEELFGNLGLFVLALGLILWFAAYMFQHRDDQKEETVFPVLFLWMSLLIYFIFVGWTSVYVSDRYMFPVYTLIWLSVILPLVIAGERLPEKYIRVPALMAVCVFTGMAYFRNSWPYMYFESAPLLEAADLHRNADCLYIYDERWKTQPSFEEMTRYSSVTFVKEDDLSKADGFKADPEKGLVILVSSENDNLIYEVKKKFPQFAQMEYNGFHGYAESWYLFNQE